MESTNLPGGIHDVAVDDPADAPNPATTRVYTTQSLQAGTTYYTTLTWQANALSGQTPYIMFVWEPSRWADPDNPTENGACLYGGNYWTAGDSRNPNEAWCINPVDPANDNVKLFGTTAFQGGFPNGDLPLDGFRWYTWAPTGSTGGITPPSSSPASRQLRAAIGRPRNPPGIRSGIRRRQDPIGNRPAPGRPNSPRECCRAISTAVAAGVAETRRTLAGAGADLTEPAASRSAIRGRWRWSPA